MPDLSFLNHDPHRQFDVRIHKKFKGDAEFEFFIPADKAIAQRAIFLNALSNGKGQIHNLSQANDVLSCIRAVNWLGVKTNFSDDCLTTFSNGIHALQPASPTIDMGNTATSTRILLSILADLPCKASVTGNSLLRKRPMGWVIEILKQMGADIYCNDAPGCLPITVKGVSPLQGIHYQGNIPSAQQKNVLLFTGLFAKGETSYEQICQARDHTERMMRYWGIPISVCGNVTTLQRGIPFTAKDITIPGDFSCAAYLLAAYLLLHPDCSAPPMFIHHTGINPTRTVFAEIVSHMGLQIQYQHPNVEAGEPAADFVCTYHSGQKPLPIHLFRLNDIQSSIDELPLLAAVSCAEHIDLLVENCGDLKEKDTDRLKMTLELINAFGGTGRIGETWMQFDGTGCLHAAHVNSHNDHRIAMTAAVLGSSFAEDTYIQNCACVFNSYPQFFAHLSHFAEIEIITQN